MPFCVWCDFSCRERGWKLKQAKRFAKAVKSSRMDVYSRAEVRLHCIPSSPTATCASWCVRALTELDS